MSRHMLKNCILDRISQKKHLRVRLSWRGGIARIWFIPLTFCLVGNAWADLSQVKIENPEPEVHGWGTGICGSAAADVVAIGAPHAHSAAGQIYVYAVGLGRKEVYFAYDGGPGDQFGRSISVSSDTIVVGAPGDDDTENDSGSAYVFTRSGETWTHQAKLTASDPGDSDHFGEAVSISGDTIIVGAYGDDDGGDVSGSAYVFTRSGTTWTEQAKLTAQDAADHDYFGRSVSISGDTVLVGASGDDIGEVDDAGSAYVFKRTGTTWAQQTKLTASDPGGMDYLGTSVSILGDTVLVGASGADNGHSDSGSAYVFVRSGTAWTQETNLTAPDGGDDHYFGGSVSISGDTVLIGAPGDGDGESVTGSAYVFVRSGPIWAQQYKLTASDGQDGDRFGKSVSVWGDTVVAGAPGDDDSGEDSGSAYVFARSDATWAEQTKLVPAEGPAGDEFGSSVAVDDDTAIIGALGYSWEGGAAYILIPNGTAVIRIGDEPMKSELTSQPVAISGNTAIVGAPGDDDGGSLSGAAYVFSRSGESWVQETKLTAVAPEAGDEFGFSVSVSTDTAIVGVAGDDGGSGAARVFAYEGSSWSEQAQLTAGDALPNARFGHSVSVSGDTAIVGAPYANDSGAAYVFTRSGQTWSEQTKLTAPDPAQGDGFGVSVSISGDTAIVGMAYDDGAANDSGSAHVFARSGQVWVPQAKLTATDAAEGDGFGSSVSVSGDKAIVGSPFDDDFLCESGSAYIFARSSGVWNQLHKLNAADGTRYDFFGTSVSIDGDSALVGAPGNDSIATDSGAAYLFDLGGGGDPTPTPTAAPTPRPTHLYDVEPVGNPDGKIDGRDLLSLCSKVRSQNLGYKPLFDFGLVWKCGVPKATP